MAVPVARVHLAMAHAALPGLLPTPPKCEMTPLLPTPPCVVILPKSPPKPSRADADERWDARKNATKSPSKPRPGRADAVERWDAHKIRPGAGSPVSSSCSSRSSPGRASSRERWDGSNKRRVSHASSAERWDEHKKPRPLQVARLDDDGQSSAGSNDEMELDTPQPQQAFYAGPGFVMASPEPSMLPLPSFMVRVA